MPHLDRSLTKRICDQITLFCACSLVFFLPISIALVEILSSVLITVFLFQKFLDVKLKMATSGNAQGPESFWKKFRQELILPNHPLGWSLLVLMGVIFLSVLFSHDRISSFISYIGKFLQGIGLMLCFYEGLRKKENLSWLMFAFILSGVMVCLSGLSQFYFSYEFLRGKNALTDGRVSSSLRHPNDFGIYLVVVIGLTMASFNLIPKLWARINGKIIKAILSVIVLLELSLLMMTFSRSAWIALIVMLTFISIINFKSIKFALPIVLIIFFIFVPHLKTARDLNFISDIGYTPKPVKQEVPSKYSTVSSKYGDDGIVHSTLIFISRLGGSGRAEYWDKALQVIQTAPVLGTGLNTYTKQVDKIPGFWGGGYAHNCYLQMTAETGLMGITAFLFFLFSLFMYALKSLVQFQDKELKYSLIIVAGTLLAYLAQSFFDTTFYSVQLGNLLWILCGIILAIINMEAKLTNQKSSL